MRDLAPEIHRQRLVIEGVPSAPITAAQIVDYLTELSDVLGMLALMTPMTHTSPKFGWAGWVHWETSGAHFYAWDVPRLFFSVDIYTCAPFLDETAVEFTRKSFDASAVEHYGF
jgi:S-adenosylmethionine decarboxylase